MNVKTALTAATIAVLGVVAAYPHVDAYVKSQPQTLTKAQAAQRYLQVVCPANALNDKRRELEKEIETEESKRYYVGSDELARANVRVGALYNNHLSVVTRFRDALVTQSKGLVNPKYVWPTEVRNDIVKLANEQFAFSSEITMWIKDRSYKMTLPAADSASRIRLALNLGPAGTGCPKVAS